MPRSSPLLEGLLTQVKQQVLAATLLQPDRAWYLHELARHLGASPSTVQHELGVFVSSGLLTRRKDGNRVYFQADRTCPIFEELARILLKTAGLVDVLKDALRPLASHIDLAMVYGSVATSTEHSQSDVDLMVVGSVSLLDLSKVLLRYAEPRLGRSVNPTVYTTEEFRDKVKRGRHFLTSVLGRELLFLYGTPDDLAKFTHRSARKKAPDEPRGTARSARRRGA